MNALGSTFKVTSFGESHGEYIGCVIEGCPAGLTLDLAGIQQQVDRRKTNQSEFSSPRQEDDLVQLVSGVYESVTLGSPIAILIKNKDAKPGDYNHLKDTYRPGHADFTTQLKYGVRDHRGGGRSSIRITAALVAAGEIARQLLAHSMPIDIKAFVTQIGSVQWHVKNEAISQSQIEASLVRCPDTTTSEQMLANIEDIRAKGDTLGGVIQCEVKGLPVGLGEPLFGKLQAQLAHAMLNINTVKGFEYGEGFTAATMTGSEHNDAFGKTEQGIAPMSNHHGGILGGISTGMPITFRVAFKPISSIQQSQQTVNADGEQVSLRIEGRHDVCAVPRAVPIVEAYTAIVLADLYLQSKLNQL
jgi:chorismate synthase